ncbi:DUF5808 domain-containing protein [Flavobacterium seoulense]|uniref:DUF5808 domain-containing protein n=1 Tax=Flavobacterium seoulense TaxID=1492738 RepID=A0A066WTX2_9FLAO|nr:DUF5808 domain-containing protein [Flavobacterium seoulense]KDN56028.1 hypothetical protein FEM21_09270 [Flavobacterium seoulense]
MEDPNNPSKETLDRWSKDPKNWIYGIFYYNPKDKRIFPPKKEAWMGFTTNFANPKSVLTLIGILLFLALFSIIIQKIK